MKQENHGAAPRQTMPIPPRRRALGKPDQRLAIINQAVLDQGAAYNPIALAEETGLPVDAIRRFAAQIVVERDMVDLGMIEPEDAIRMGSEALAASLRIVGKGHSGPQRHIVAVDEATPAPRHARTLRAVDLMGLRRMEQRAAAQERRPVASPRTPCPNCGSLPGIHGGCRHQRLMTPDETTGQGLPNA
ncbi:hypothetical protein [Novosphingobium sp. KACC 22771]|uniref:hypothetical protein n=1 Tax=Novosphingobium sp. KACC 22771 TaxID=3025670 RepID=UPI0023666146|nr:hypothetical protein [Novosphingobium sp. KACC 22771]WDF71499.1 hypothetical protein PQ467_11850 [Novosphingobium sp. KACC 22771]